MVNPGRIETDKATSYILVILLFFTTMFNTFGVGFLRLVTTSTIVIGITGGYYC